MRSTSADEKKLKKYMTLTLVQEKIQTHHWICSVEKFSFTFYANFQLTLTSLIIKRAEKNKIKNVFYLLYAF